MVCVPSSATSISLSVMHMSNFRVSTTPASTASTQVQQHYSDYDERFTTWSAASSDDSALWLGQSRWSSAWSVDSATSLDCLDLDEMLDLDLVHHEYIDVSVADQPEVVFSSVGLSDDFQERLTTAYGTDAALRDPALRERLLRRDGI
jgi:hypothetical protein